MQAKARSGGAKPDSTAQLCAFRKTAATSFFADPTASPFSSK